MKVTKEAIQTTQQPIDHWKRMIERAESQDPGRITDYYYMEIEIGENWYSEDCPLCKHFLYETVCGNCPLRVVFGLCSDPSALNAWSNVRWARTWGEWLEAAEVMLFQLETVLKLLKEADNA